MGEILAALAPVFLLIAVGFGARIRRLVSAEAFGAVNRFGYLLLYPAFLFSTIATADFARPDTGPFLGGVLAGFVAMAGLALILRPLVRGPTSDPAFTSVFQGATRWNGFALLAAADSLYGPGATALVALAFGPVVLLVNVLCVVVLAKWGEAPAQGARQIVGQILANPLVLACAAGIAANLAGVGDLGPLTATLKLLGGAAMPIALVCVGAGLDMSSARRGGALVGLAGGMKLLAAPLVLYGCALACGAGPLAAAVAAGMGATPTAAASYTLAREMGGDARLMAAIVTATTLASFVTMPAVILLTRP